MRWCVWKIYKLCLHVTKRDTKYQVIPIVLLSFRGVQCLTSSYACENMLNTRKCENLDPAVSISLQQHSAERRKWRNQNADGMTLTVSNMCVKLCVTRWLSVQLNIEECLVSVCVEPCSECLHFGPQSFSTCEKGASAAKNSTTHHPPIFMTRRQGNTDNNGTDDL